MTLPAGARTDHALGALSLFSVVEVAQVDERLLQPVEVAQVDERLLQPVEVAQVDERLLQPVEVAQVDERLLQPVEVAQVDERLLQPVEVAQVDERLLQPVEVAQVDERLLQPVEVAQVDERLLQPVEVAQVDERLLQPVEVAQVDERLLQPVEVAQVDERLLQPVEVAQVDERLLQPVEVAQVDERLLQPVEVAQVDERLLQPVEVAQVDERLLQPVEVAQVDERLLQPVEVAQVDERLLQPVEVAQVDERLLQPVEVAQVDERLLQPVEVAQVDERFLQPVEIAQVDERLFQPVEVAQLDKPAAATEVSYNTAFLQGGGDNLPLELLSQGPSMLPGVYDLEIYINKRPIGRKTVSFVVNPATRLSEPCFSLAVLEGMDIVFDKAIKEKIEKSSSDECFYLSDVLPKQADVDVDTSRLRLLLTVPQAYLQEPMEGRFVESALWDNGVSAAFTSYGVTVRRSRGLDASSQVNYNVTLDNGVNFLGFRLRNTGALTYASGGTREYTNGVTYIERDVDALRSQLSVGEIFSNGELFNSASIRGVKLETDPLMFPDNAFSYRPTVSGIAESNAIVEIRQAGLLVYSENVPPGPFNIKNYNYSSGRGDLELTIVEENGQRRVSIIPNGNLPVLVPKGQFKYSFAAGQLRGQTSDQEKINLVSMNAAYGLGETVTVLGGAQTAKDYRLFGVGAGALTRLGAISIDGQFSRADVNGESFSGSSVRARYSKSLTDFDTSVAVASQTFTSRRYMSLGQYVSAVNAGNNLSLTDTNTPRFRTDVSLSQPLGSSGKYGNLSLSVSQQRTWLGSTSRSLSASYSVNLKPFAIGFNATQTKRSDDGSDNGGKTETIVGVSVGLSFDSPSQNSRHFISSSYQRNNLTDSSNTSLSASGSLPFANDLNYNAQLVRANNGTNNVNSASVGLSKATSLGNVAGFASYASGGTSSQGMSMTGAVVLHRGGINFANGFLRDGFVLVDADGVPGIAVGAGSVTAYNGYAVMTGITPYRVNLVSANQVSLDSGVDLVSSSDMVVPRRGLTTKAKFEVSKGRRVRFELKDSDGNVLPFGAFVLSEEGSPLGVADPQGLALVLLKADQGTLTISWDNKTCNADYKLGDKTSTNNFESADLMCMTQAQVSDPTGRTSANQPTQGASDKATPSSSDVPSIDQELLPAPISQPLGQLSRQDMVPAVANKDSPFLMVSRSTRVKRSYE